MLSLFNQNCHGSAHRDVLGPGFHQQLGDNAIILQAQITQSLRLTRRSLVQARVDCIYILNLSM